MKTSKEVRVEFEEELKSLLKKYNTEIEMEEIRRGYGGSEYSMKIYIPTVWNNNEVISESVEIDLGNYYYAD